MKICITKNPGFRVFFMCTFFLTLLITDEISFSDPVDDCGFPIVSVPGYCGKCHGAPPDTPTHPPNNRCFRCHGQVVDDAFYFTETGLHKNGTVEYSVGCTSCHGWDLGVSPPQNLSGECSQSAVGVGAHVAHRRYAIPAHQTNCSNCHQIPLSLWEPGHIDGDGVVEVQFGMLATAHDATPVWNGNTCSGVYCHGATLSGGSLTTPSWTDTSGAAGQCGACHSVENNTCYQCHSSTLDSNNQILPMGTHIDGEADSDY